MIFGTVREGILEILDERLSAFRAKMVALVGMRSLTFKEFWERGAPYYHRVRDSIASMR